jgi:hypothetical protein
MQIFHLAYDVQVHKYYDIIFVVYQGLIDYLLFTSRSRIFDWVAQSASGFYRMVNAGRASLIGYMLCAINSSHTF